jgi:hypothetical protein
VFDAASASGSSAASSEASDGEAGAASDSSAEWVMANGAVMPAPEAHIGGADAAKRGTGKKAKRRRGSGDDYDEDVFAPAEDYAEALAADAPVVNGGRGRDALRPGARGGRAASGGSAAGVQRPRGGKRGKRAQSAAARHL